MTLWGSRGKNNFYFRFLRMVLPYFYFRSEIDVIVMFLDPNFLRDAGILAIKAEIGIYMSAWIFRTFWPKMAV